MLDQQLNLNPMLKSYCCSYLFILWIRIEFWWIDKTYIRLCILNDLEMLLFRWFIPCKWLVNEINCSIICLGVLESKITLFANFKAQNNILYAFWVSCPIICKWRELFVNGPHLQMRVIWEWILIAKKVLKNK